MTKKILVLILAGALLVFMVACGDDIPVVDEFEINVSGGGFFDDINDTADTDTASSPEAAAASGEEISDTEGA